MPTPIVPPIAAGSRANDIANLQDALLLLYEREYFTVPAVQLKGLIEQLAAERVDSKYGEATQKLVFYFQVQSGVGKQLQGARVDDKTVIKMNEQLKALGAFDVEKPKEGDSAFNVSGKVASGPRVDVGKLTVKVFDKDVGRTDELVATTMTADDGSYDAAFPASRLKELRKKQPDLQVLVSAGDRELGRSDVRYGASRHETLNVLLDDKASTALPSEYESLRAALAVYFGGKLAELKERDGQQDFTYLANKTGWDARLVALAALADQFSARTAEAAGGAIEPAFFYVLFRTGVPANDAALLNTDLGDIEKIWHQAITQGIIPAVLENRIPEVVGKFRQLTAKGILDIPVQPGIASMKDVLAVSLGDDRAKHEQFAALYAKESNDLSKLWQGVREAFGDAVENRLKLDGQLAYLTLNNAPLMRALHAAQESGDVTDVLDLVKGGLYRAERWQSLIADGLIPASIPGKDAAEKKSRYAELLAAQVRLGFPTAVVAQMVKNKEIELFDARKEPVASNIVEEVHTFLSDHQGKFEIGLQPIEQYAKINKVDVSPEVKQEVTRIQRVYQITPTDDAMSQLLKQGVDSACAIVRYDREDFVQAFGDKVGGEETARLIHAKSEQVYNAVLNIAVSYRTASAAPGIGVHSDPSIINGAPVPNDGDVIAYPTLEQLFGELDFCECEHCRSILSPAAYLVDLLEFIDPPRHPDPSPQKVLFARRPDIQYLPLTCENTNTPLPYIDLVNETMEYFVTHGSSLTNFKGHTCGGDISNEELLASPQFVNVEAYRTLRDARFPVPLPFHQPLENLRRLFNRFEAPLPNVMEALRQNDDLERATDNDYGWRDILIEELGLSRAEHDILTRIEPLPLKNLFGYPSDAENVKAELANAKTLARRVGISYDNLVDILKTRFVNPSSVLVAKLERLGVTLGTLHTLAATPKEIANEAFNALLPTDAEAIDPRAFGQPCAVLRPRRARHRHAAPEPHFRKGGVRPLAADHLRRQ
jgi:hypothetical protein